MFWLLSLLWVSVGEILVGCHIIPSPFWALVLLATVHVLLILALSKNPKVLSFFIGMLLCNAGYLLQTEMISTSTSAASSFDNVAKIIAIIGNIVFVIVTNLIAGSQAGDTLTGFFVKRTLNKIALEYAAEHPDDPEGATEMQKITNILSEL